MSAQLLWEHARIHNTQSLDAVDPAFQINHARVRSRAHPRRPNRMVQRKGFFLREQG